MPDYAIKQTYRILHQTVQVCHAHGVNSVVLCPGSRSAPVALSFIRFEGIAHYVIPDERSAAYTALGMARQSGKPVALVCTSGTAALNFAPAVAEAFFSEIPLIVFTADRPPEWIGQADNQAIHQAGLYGKNIKTSYQLPVEYTHPDAEWYAIRQVNEAMNTAISQPRGPVHINVPLREPLYMDADERIESVAPKVIRTEKSEKSLPVRIFETLRDYKKVLVVAGTHRPNEKMSRAIMELCLNRNMVFIPDITSNLVNTEGSVSFAELIIDTLTGQAQQDFVPELVISFGGPVVSKVLKNFLKDKAVKAHWQLNAHPGSADTFQHLTNLFDISAPDFFMALNDNESVKFDPGYFEHWTEKDISVKFASEHILRSLPFGEIRAAYEIMHSLAAGTVVHLGNSLPVRYASAFPHLNPAIEVYSNRGTSGIDGTVSAAAGQSMADDRMHVLICGDLAFMYDSNGLWNNYLNDNLKIIVFNNHGGGIFRNLPGARDQQELEEYFAVKQPLNFEHTALQHNCYYYFAKGMEEFKETFATFLGVKGRPAVLEIEFDTPLSITEVKKMVYSSMV